MFRKTIFTLCAVTSLFVNATDWPAFRHDHLRSGKSSEQLKAATLKKDWVYDNIYKPEPAWYGPAKRDAYDYVEGLRSMRDYDTVLHTIAVADKLFFGSTVDHSVYCLDANSGKMKWRFITDGPVRVVPTWHKKRLYFGSDDGYLYCLDANSGELVWKYSPVSVNNLLVTYSNLNSLSPCRTGVTISGDKLFCGFSMLPWEKTYLCALNVETGKEIYSEEFADLTMEAPFAYTAGRLIAPQGRISPVIFNAKTGKKIGSLGKGGGSFVLVTDDNHVIHGPGNKRGWINDSELDHPAKIVSIQGANAMIIKGNRAFVLSDKELSALDRGSNAKVWTQPSTTPFSLILGGTVLYAGGMDKVAAFDSVTGKQLFEAAVDGRVKGLTVANGRLLVSTDTGKVYAFKESKSYKWASSPLKKSLVKEIKGGILPLAGPFVNYIGGDKAVISWQTSRPIACELFFYSGNKVIKRNTPAGTRHEVNIKGLKHNFIHHYRISFQGKSSPMFELDSFFNFKVNLPQVSSKMISKNPQLIKILNEAKVTSRGIALVAGINKGDLALQLIAEDFRKVICLDTDINRVNKLCERLFKLKLYGRVVVRLVSRFDSSILPEEFANIVVSEHEASSAQFPSSFTSFHRFLKTGEGIIVSLNDKTDLTKFVPKVFHYLLRNRYIRALSLKDSSDWTHQYGNPDNAGFTGEGLGGSSKADQLRTQWIGRPGPRFQSDRSGRKTSPLVAGGRLFVQGLERIVAVDRANGTVLWSKEIPGFMRFNIPRDCSNWCTDGSFIYAVNRDHCLKVDCQTGDIVSVIPITPSKITDKCEWSYIASYKNYIVGSSTKSGTHHTNYFGGAGAGWYDATSGPVTYKLCSDNIFVRSKRGRKMWSYEKGLIINPTITVKGGRIFFIESHSKSLKAGKSRRLTDSEEFSSTLYLTALELKSGKVLWKKRIKAENIKVMLQLAAAGNTLIVQSSGNVKYELYTYEARTGKLLWHNDGPWQSDNHGGHMSRPVIVGNKVYIRPNVYDLSTGYRLDNMRQPYGSCGTYCATSHSIIYRHGTVSMWGMEDNSITKWSRLRPGCWLSTVPAEGMILSPEAGGGCSCGNWLETSVGFSPIKRAKLMFGSADKQFVDMMKIELVNLSGVGDVRYTIDGAEPTKSSKKYMSAFLIKNDTMIKASVFAENSEVLGSIERKFIKLYPSPTFADESGFVLAGTSKRVQVKNGVGGGGVIRFTLDGTVPTEKSSSIGRGIVIKQACKISLCAFYEGGGKSGVTTKEFKLVEMVDSVVVDNTKPGLKFSTYYKKLSKLPDLSKLKADKEGVSNSFDISKSGKANDFAMFYEGYIKVPKEGIYRFELKSDDGSKLWIANRLVVDNDGLHGADKLKSGLTALKAGLHPIQVAYFDAGGGKSLKVSIVSPDRKRRQVRGSMLLH